LQNKTNEADKQNINKTKLTHCSEVEYFILNKDKQNWQINKILIKQNWQINNRLNVCTVCTICTVLLNSFLTAAVLMYNQSTHSVHKLQEHHVFLQSTQGTVHVTQM
jgi:uncharacterized protein YpmB